MKKMIKFLVLTLVMLISVQALSACSQSKGESKSEISTSNVSTSPTDSTAEATENTPVTITIGSWPTADSDNYDTYQGYIETMKEKYPYITIETSEYVYSVDSFLPLAASGQLPTLYSTYYTEANKIIDAGYAADITSTVKDYGYDTAINADLLKLVTVGDKIYGLPVSAYSMGLWYNVSLWKEAGLVDENGVPLYPSTYEELAADCQIIKEKTGKSGFFMLTENNQGGWTFMNIAWSYGAIFEQKVNDKWTATFNSPEAVAALQYVKDLRWKYNCLQDDLLADNTNLLSAFGTDQVATTFGLYEWVPYLLNATEYSKDNLAMSQVPGGPAGRSALMGGSVYMFSPTVTSEQVDACMKYLQVTGFTSKMTEDTKTALTQKYQADAADGLPVGPTGIQVWAGQSYLDAVNSIITANQNVDMKLWNNYCDNISVGLHAEEPVNAQELYVVLDAVIQEVLTNENVDPQTLLDEAVANFQKNYLDAANSSSN
jgi:ABC-type glycerol-3-phosphate transport system substrate-binding protein